ncbi:hypothetical protein GW931_00230 [archaeon]|nr:hypothetical protein [archaeon]PJC45570.1 MAG: hypothetical protein CO037_00770 [Candidatus Pacearchaeota archaeon CG_4_9_14_0_2_um_filter_30_8]
MALDKSIISIDPDIFYKIVDEKVSKLDSKHLWYEFSVKPSAYESIGEYLKEKTHSITPENSEEFLNFCNPILKLKELISTDWAEHMPVEELIIVNRNENEKILYDKVSNGKLYNLYPLLIFSDKFFPEYAFFNFENSKEIGGIYLSTKDPKYPGLKDWKTIITKDINKKILRELE